LKSLNVVLVVFERQKLNVVIGRIVLDRAHVVHALEEVVRLLAIAKVDHSALGEQAQPSIIFKLEQSNFKAKIVNLPLHFEP
jgi:hypothetical protein